MHKAGEFYKKTSWITKILYLSMHYGLLQKEVWTNKWWGAQKQLWYT